MSIKPAFLYFRQRYDPAVRSMTFFWSCKMISVRIRWFKFFVQNSTIIKINFLHFKKALQADRVVKDSFEEKTDLLGDIESILYVNMKYSLVILNTNLRQLDYDKFFSTNVSCWQVTSVWHNSIDTDIFNGECFCPIHLRQETLIYEYSISYKHMPKSCKYFSHSLYFESRYGYINHRHDMRLDER